MMHEFFSVDKPISDPNFAKKLQELDLYYKSCLEEMDRIERLLKNKKSEEEALLNITNAHAETTKKNSDLINKNNGLTNAISEGNTILADLDNCILNKNKELKLYSDLTEEISALQKEKDNIMAYNKANKVEKDDLSYIRLQIDLAKTHLSELEKKSKEVVDDMNEKRLLADKFDRDMDRPTKILAEIKQTELSVQTTLQATKDLIEKENIRPGSIVDFIRKAQAKYPKIDLLNI